MKYGESTFDILYLLFAIISGIVIIAKAKNRTERLMGIAAVTLGAGDAFHLVPRVMNYFGSSDMTAALGMGKLVTSITMTIFYVLLYYIYLGYYKETKNKATAAAIWILAAVRMTLCFMPQNGWMENSNNLTWAIIRNIPFVILGAIICVLYFKKRKAERIFAPVWIYILLSFLFYIPVTVAAGFVPILGMLMLPKTVCYILLIITFIRAQHKSKESEPHHDRAE